MRCFHLIIMICVLTSLTAVSADAKSLKRSDMEKTGSVYWDIRSEKKKLSLTFDDGPHPVYTEAVLDVLKQHNVKATFFCVGSRIDKYPITAKRIVEEGHEIGNHTMNHVYFHRLKRKDILQELHSSAHHITSLQPEGDKLFRPPGGSLNHTAFKSILKEGYHIIMWSWNQDPRDWKRPGKGKIVRHVVSHARDGDIVLLHDGGGNRRQTVEALKEIIPKLKKQGYTFVKVSDLIGQDSGPFHIQ
ncbi:polysaccharide deacetylase family protein [Bacillus velezensis]|uniref:polysaccharide deacetylase family protein n=1 Tax=Bacillus velezensis TaxID=492670 RepID=UPI0004DB58B5|nr:polysaccharide deacetylase family protein [Bacillus velezensis]MCY7682234.1 polysaccharide deacetylase family protein [Bacillus velezensis]